MVRISRIAAIAPALVLAAATQAGVAESSASGPEILASQPRDVALRLRREKVVMLQEFGEGEVYGGPIYALVVFERPKSEVMRQLIQSPRQIEYRPELREARVIEEFARGHVVHYEMRMMLMRVEYRARHGWDFEAGRIWWSLEPEADNDFAALDGRWELFELGAERTLGRFGSRIDVGPALPAFLQDLATRKKLPEAMQNVRRWVDSGGTYRP